MRVEFCPANILIYRFAAEVSGLIFAPMNEWTAALNTLGAAGRPCFFLLDFERRRPRVWTLDDPRRPRFAFPGHPSDAADNGPEPSRSLPRLSIRAGDNPGLPAYQRAFEVVQSGLQRGDSFLTNLTFPIHVELDVGLAEVYHAAEAKYRILWPDRFVCFSPETFVTVSPAGYLESRPMKGTSLDDAAARDALLKSPKELAEHATIVDLIRNDLSQVAGRVRVTDYRYFHAISTGRRGLVQTSSNIGGQLPANWRENLGDILAKLTPAGSVSGAPKSATLDIIRRAEPGPRGYYCGVAGYFDGLSLDTCVLIRFIEKTADGYVFRSGGGITAQSDLEEEYAELLAKVRIPGS